MSVTSMIGTGASVAIFSGTVLVFFQDYIVPKLEIITEVLSKSTGG